MEKGAHRDGLSLRSESRVDDTTSSHFVLQWGNRKRERLRRHQVKGQNINNSSPSSDPVQRTTARINRRVVRPDRNNTNGKDLISDHHINKNNACKSNGDGSEHLNLRPRQVSPSHRILRNSEGSSIGMKGNGNGVGGLVSPDRSQKKSNNNHNNKNNIIINNKSNSHHHHDNHHQSSSCAGSGSSEDGKKDGSSSGGGDAIAVVVWPPKFAIALTNKEKEEDFMAIKGSKLPQRPKKRAKVIQRTLNLVSPGAWLCDLTLERYEVREKKVAKKKSRGLKAMGNMESDSE